MFRRFIIWLGVLVVITVGMTRAQGQAANVAFVNSSGQLVMTSGDGAMRWIVTNPGEMLAQPLGFSWSPDGRQLFFAVSLGEQVSLRIADVGGQAVSEIGQVGGAVSGGEWTPDGRGVMIASGEQVLLYPAAGGGPAVLFSGGGSVVLRSPFASDRPNLSTARSLSPDGRFVFYWQSEGSQGLYQIFNVGTGGMTALPVLNDASAPQSGLWADSAPMVAYWGFANGSSVLAVTHAANGQTVTLNSGRTAPIAPIAWQPGTRLLVYRDTTDVVRITSLDCLESGCGANPLENGAPLVPATASDIQIPDRAGWLYFRDGDLVKALNLACVGGGTCLDSAVTLADGAAQRTWVHAAGSTLVYTGTTGADYREARVVNLQCLNDPASCQPVTVLTQAIAGLVSPNGQYVVVDQAGSGLNALHIPSLNMTYMSGAMSGGLGAGLALARWG